MKAIIFQQHGDDVLQLQDIAKPVLKPNEVLVKIEYAGLNHLDIWVRKGNPAYTVKLPHVLGADGAGVIESVGAEAEGVSIGDRVLIMPALSCGTCVACRKAHDNQCESFEILGAKRAGTYAEYVALPDENILPIPDGISMQMAAALPLSYLTAWHMLQNRARLQKGETVLVVGASAGVSVAAIQISKLMGARVLAMTTNLEKAEKIKTLGADQVFVQEESNDFYKWVLQQTDGNGVEVVFEHVGPATWEKSLKSLARYGRLVTCGATTGPSVPLDLRYVFSRNLSILGARMGTKKDFQELMARFFSGEIKPVIDRIFPLDEAQQAHTHMEERRQLGKILLKI